MLGHSHGGGGGGHGHGADDQEAELLDDGNQGIMEPSVCNGESVVLQVSLTARDIFTTLVPVKLGLVLGLWLGLGLGLRFG